MDIIWISLFLSQNIPAFDGAACDLVAILSIQQIHSFSLAKVEASHWPHLHQSCVPSLPARSTRSISSSDEESR